MLIDNKLWIDQITQLILKLLRDERVEVRESAAHTLSGLLHCELILINQYLIKQFETDANQKLRKNGLKSMDPNYLAIRHSGVLGLCACINAYPYEVPYFMPDMMLFLIEHLNDPQPIPV